MPLECFVCKAGREPAATDLHGLLGKRGYGYLAGALLALERRLGERDLTCFITQDLRHLPRYGADVVAAVVGDEEGHVPRYAHRIAAAFKPYGARPFAMARPLREPACLTFVAALLDTRTLARTLPGRLAGRVSGAAQSSVPIPLGWYQPPALEGPPMAERPVDVTFTGSLRPSASRTGPLRWLPTPKERARTHMLAQVRSFAAAQADVRVAVALSEDFRGSKTSSAEEYWRRLAAARICLVPRGNAAETHRLYEAARAGCAVVCERLPPHDFYAGAPFVQLASWGDLAPALGALLADPAALEERRRETVAWWERTCSAEAVADRMAWALGLQAVKPPSTRSSCPVR